MMLRVTPEIEESVLLYKIGVEGGRATRVVGLVGAEKNELGR